MTKGEFFHSLWSVGTSREMAKYVDWTGERSESHQ